MKKKITIIWCLIIALAATANEYAGKAIYLPEQLADNDFTSPDSQWSLSRMASTENIVLFWAPGFGDNIESAPDLEGQDMKVNLANLLAKLERFYHYFYNDLGWAKPGSNADKYKMMVMLDYSLEGTAYGGDYDGVIGALWVTPNRLKDEGLNCVAHELGHSFQSQITCDGEGECWGGAGIFEMASQWMLWQVNPDWQRDENYHLQAFQALTHKAFLHLDNIYHSPYVLEYWSEKHGLPFVAELFRQGAIGEDPVMTYKRITNIDQEQFCDEMYQAQSLMVNWDYPRVWDNTRKYACKGWNTKLVKKGNRYMPAPENCPENYGFNVIPLVPLLGDSIVKGDKVTIDFKGEPKAAGYHTINNDKAGWRYGLVAVDHNGKTVYTPMQKGQKGQITFEADTDYPNLYLVVMGAPKEHWQNIDGDENPGDAQWPYSFTVRNHRPH